MTEIENMRENIRELEGLTLQVHFQDNKHLKKEKTQKMDRQN